MGKRKQNYIVGFGIDPHGRHGRKFFKDGATMRLWLTGSEYGELYATPMQHSDTRDVYFTLTDQLGEIKQADFNCLASVISCQSLKGRVLVLGVKNNKPINLQASDIRYLTRICKDEWDSLSDIRRNEV